MEAFYKSFSLIAGTALLLIGFNNCGQVNQDASADDLVFKIDQSGLIDSNEIDGVEVSGSNVDDIVGELQVMALEQAEQEKVSSDNGASFDYETFDCDDGGFFKIDNAENPLKGRVAVCHSNGRTECVDLDDLHYHQNRGSRIGACVAIDSN